jgi:membrane protease YdiL (CAAX protease family)
MLVCRVLAGSAVIILAEGGAYELLTGNGAALPITQMPLAKAAMAFFSVLLLYMVVNTEEIAWCGFVLPRLQNGNSALTASLLIWLPWTLFHLPYFFTKGNMFQQIGLLAFASGTLTVSIVFTWLFISTKGSVFICTFLHAALNTWPLLLMPSQITMPGWLGYMSELAIALFFVLTFGAARLSRKRDSEPFLY